MMKGSNNEVSREEVSAYREDAPEVNSFDEFSRGIADGTLSRGQMLKLMGVTVLGGLLATGFPGIAEAKKKKKKKKKKQGGCNPKPAGASCQTSAECCPNTTKRICAVASNASNSDTTCCGGAGATCGPKNQDGDDTAPFCCAGFTCTNGSCQPVPEI